MLGRRLRDPAGIEGPAGETAGLGFLACETTLDTEKQLRNVHGRLQIADRAPITGYEIHMGVTTGVALNRPAVSFDDGRSDGALSEDGQILGTYCHGLFDQPQALAALLAWAGAASIAPVDLPTRREADIDRLADAADAALDWTLLNPLLATR